MGSEEKRSLWRSRAAIAVMVLLLGSVVALLVGAGGWKRDLKVKSVEVLGERILPASDIVAQAAINRGDKLYAVDLAGVKQRIEANPLVRRATVQRDAPGRITIVVEEREPVAAVVADRFFFVDQEGVVLPAVGSDSVFDLPVITGLASTPTHLPGEKLSSTLVQEALALIKTAKMISDEMYHQISEIHLEDQREMVVYTAEYGIPVIIGIGNAVDQLVKLEAFWKNIVSREGAQGLQYVDLRFEDQVVVRWNHGRPGIGD